MQSSRFCTGRSRCLRALAILLVALSLGSLLAGCDNSTPTPQVLIVTATFTPQTQVQIVTATFTPTPEKVQVVTATFTPTSEAPPVEPSATLDTSVQQPAQPENTVAPTAVPPQPTATLASIEPTATLAPEPTATLTPEPTATTAPKPKASLASYGVIYSNFDGGDETDEHKYSVWVMRGDGKQASEIIRPAIEPAYSPNGKKIAFYRPFNGIWVYDLDKESATHIVASDFAEFASFSPDGKQLVFHEWIGNWWSANVHLHIVNADGSNRRQLPEGIRPAWSPKGGLIAFDSCRGTSCGIFVVQPNGQGLRQVTSEGGGKVSWSPNGKKLVYSADTDGDPEIWVVNVDGTGRKQLTKNTGNDTLPVYSPDGQYIYFLSDQNGTAWAIRVMNANGSNVKTIRKIGVPPRWQFSRLWVGWW
jgi:WD40 repeat protein